MIFLISNPLAYLVQLLDNREDEESRNQTDTSKNTPDGHKVEILTPHYTWNHYQLVTDSCSTEQRPIINPEYFGGATFDTNEIPIGESNSSANVRMR